MLVTPAPIVAYIVCFTYLDSSTIKSQLPELVHSFTTTYFYCDHKDAATHSFRKFVVEMIVQLIRLDAEGYRDLESLYEKCHNDHARTPTLSDLLDLSKALSNRFVRTYVILDALDEVGNVNVFLKGLENLRAYINDSSTIRILVTSRRELAIERSMLAQTAIQVQMVSKETQTDLIGYIYSQIQQRIASRRLKLRDPQLEHEIATTLINHADGMSVYSL